MLRSLKVRRGKYRVMYVNPTTEIGGGTQSQLSLISGLEQERFYPVVIVPEGTGPLIKKLEAQGIETYVMPLNRLRRRNPFPYFLTVFRLAKFIKKKKIDLVHSNIEFTNQYLMPAARLAGVPAISHVRNLLTREGFFEYLFWLSDVFIANSYATERSYRPFLGKRQKSCVIHNGVNLDWFRPDIGRGAIRRKLGFNDRTFVIGVAGRLVPDKGHFWFLDAFKKITVMIPDVRALIVGGTKLDCSESYLQELKARVKTLELTEEVIFTGFIEDIAGVYNSLDLLVLPSKREPFGRVLVEAMAMERPVIATDGGGCPEIIVPGKTGFLVAYGDTAGLAEAVLRIIKNPALGREFGIEGRKRVEGLFDMKIITKKIEQLYMDILTS